MLRGTDNFYFILITFSFQLELVLINRVILRFLTEVPIWASAPPKEKRKKDPYLIAGYEVYVCVKEGAWSIW